MVLRNIVLERNRPNTATLDLFSLRPSPRHGRLHVHGDYLQNRLQPIIGRLYPSTELLELTSAHFKSDVGAPEQSLIGRFELFDKSGQLIQSRFTVLECQVTPAPQIRIDKIKSARIVAAAL